MSYDHDLDAPPDPFRDPPHDPVEWLFSWKGLAFILAVSAVLTFGLKTLVDRSDAAHVRENRAARESCVERGGRPVEDQYGWFTECHWD